MLSNRMSGFVAASIAVTTMIACGSDHQAEHVGAAEAAVLSGSTFEGDDGNLILEPGESAPTHTDWCNLTAAELAALTPPNVCPKASLVTGFAEGIDKPSGNTDNSFGQGTKEDNVSATIVTGSVPPNKNDLTRFYVGSEFVNGSDFLYLAWERAVNTGNANIDFEINQKAQPFNATTTGPVTLNRTAGDILITYDFPGSGSPSLGLLTWVTSATTPVVPGFATNACFSANSFPCWGDRVDLSAAGFAEGAVNAGSIVDPIPDAAGQNAPRTLGAGLFGEAAINLTAAGVFPPGVCESFGSTFVKSRSSSSFTAEVKDFIAPTPVNISNCGEIKIIKHTDPRGINQNFSFTSNIPGTGNDSFTLNDAGNTTQDNAANTKDIKNVPAGSYIVTEGAEPAGFTLESLVCTATPGSSGAQDPTTLEQANITVAAGGVVTCTYTNKQQLGAIRISKTSIKGTALAGAKFSISSVPGSPFTTDQNGIICVDHLIFGTYSVQEIAAPSGYLIDDGSVHTVTVNANSTCGDGNEAKLAFTDTPLTDIECKATSEATGGTKSHIVCVDAGGNIVASSGATFVDPAMASATGLKPGTYTCTITVDP